MPTTGAFTGTRWLVLLGGSSVRFAERSALQSLLAEHGASVCLRLPSTASRDCCRVLATSDYVAAYREYEAQEPARRPLCPPAHVRHIDAAVRAGVPVVLPAFVRDCALCASKNEPLPDISAYAQFSLLPPQHQTETSKPAVTQLEPREATQPEVTTSPPPQQQQPAAPIAPAAPTAPTAPAEEKRDEKQNEAQSPIQDEHDNKPVDRKADEMEVQQDREEPEEPEEPERLEGEEEEEEEEDKQAQEPVKNSSQAFIRAAKRREAHARKHDAEVVAQRQARLLEKQRRREARLLAAAANPMAAVAQRTAQRRRGCNEYQQHLQWHATRAQHSALCAAAEAPAAKLALRKVFVGGVSTTDIDSARLQEVLPTGEVRDRTQCVRQQRINAVKALFASFGKITQWKPDWAKGYIHVVYSSPKEAALCLRRLGSPEGRVEVIAALGAQLHANRLLHSASEAQAALPQHMYVRAAHEREHTAS